MAEIIHTKWHKFVDAVNASRIAMHAGNTKEQLENTFKKNSFEIKQADMDSMKLFVNAANGLPTFYLDREVQSLLLKEEVTKSLEAMHKAGITKLPFPELIVEWDYVMKDGSLKRYFCIVEERDYEREPRTPDEKGEHPWVATLLRYRLDNGEDFAVLSPSLVYVGFDTEAGPEQEFGFHYASTPAYYWVQDPALLEPYMHATIADEALHIGEAIAAIMLLMHTKGIKKTQHSAPKLSKAREKRGQAPVPTVTTLSIGMVYNEHGEGQAYGSGTRGPTRVHWRRGHNRGVWHGPGRKQHKIVFIEPCLVNYVDGDETPQAQFRVKP